jgi:hypothetical protein
MYSPVVVYVVEGTIPNSVFYTLRTMSSVSFETFSWQRAFRNSSLSSEIRNTNMQLFAFMTQFLLSTQARKTPQRLPLTARLLTNQHGFGCGPRPRRVIRGVF